MRASTPKAQKLCRQAIVYYRRSQRRSTLTLIEHR